MTYLNQKLKCEDCFKPVVRRLGLFQVWPCFTKLFGNHYNFYDSKETLISEKNIMTLYPSMDISEAKDEYECYSDSYVKCFWGLCDYHNSIDNFTNVPKEKVITTQPIRQGVSIQSAVHKQILVKN